VSKTNWVPASAHSRTRKSQYETQLAKWGMSKSVKKEDWKFVNDLVQRARKRNLDELDDATAVYLDGELIEQKKLKKEFSRHGDLSVAYRLRYTDGTAVPSSHENHLRVC